MRIESMLINVHLSSRILITKNFHMAVLHILSAFAKFQNTTFDFVIPLFPSVWLSGHIDQPCSHWGNFHKILYLIFFENMSRKYKFNESLIRVASYLHAVLSISCSVLIRMRTVSEKP